MITFVKFGGTLSPWWGGGGGGAVPEAVGEYLILFSSFCAAHSIKCRGSGVTFMCSLPRRDSFEETLGECFRVPGSNSVLETHPALNLNIPEFLICPFSVFPFLQVMLIGSGFLVQYIHAFNDGICFLRTELSVFILTSHCCKIFIEGCVSIRHSEDVVVTISSIGWVLSQIV